MTLTEELRAAAARLRDNRNCDGFLVDCNSRELLEMIRVLLAVREPLAAWLEWEAETVSSTAWAPINTSLDRALAVARAINGATDPGRGGDGHIEDKLSGRSIYEQLLRAAGETP